MKPRKVHGFLRRSFLFLRFIASKSIPNFGNHSEKSENPQSYKPRKIRCNQKYHRILRKHPGVPASAFLEKQEESVKFADYSGRYEEARDFVSGDMDQEFRERHPMKLHRLISLSSLLLVTTIGCCHSQCVSSNPCDPCGRGMSGGCCLTNWIHKKMSCQNYSWADECSSCGCSVCGGDNCGVGSTPAFSGGGSTCGCGQSHGGNYAPTTTTPSIPPTDPNRGEPPMPIPRNGEPNPAPPSTTFQQPASGQIQHVSMEEFQRLPGVVVSGPGSSVPTMAQPNLAPPTLSNVSVPPRPANSVQQAQWIPAK